MAAEPAFVSVTPGTLVKSGDRQYRITHQLGMDSVLAQDIETTALERLRIDTLRPPSTESPGAAVAKGQDLGEFSEEDWKEAQRRFQAIRPLIEDPYRTREKAKALAKAAKIHVATLYQWMNTYLEASHISALIPRPRGRKPGTRKLSDAVEKIVETAIQDMLLSRQRHTPQDVANEVDLRCHRAGVEAPHPNTVRNRIREIPPSLYLRKRGLRDKARSLYQALQGNFPGADFPLAVVQIDHTEADIIVVDERTRQAMGRPWITLAIDVFSRMVVGCAISMEKPSAISAGICVANAMLPKGEYLAELELGGEWPVWGRIGTLHADNAKEFRGTMLRRGCEQYGIDLQLRPVKLPHYGGHIERLMGTTANELRKLPGATFSNPVQRKGYDSEKESALTLREFEQHLVDFIVSVYHQRVHSELGMPPKRKWELGVLGDAANPGRGIPDVPSDPMRIRLDFMPLVEHTVQPYGILLDKVHYYHEVLNKWINAKNPNNPKEKRKFLIRRDPRDISRVYFFDPESKAYFAIPYRDTTHPAISVWELREAQRRLREEGWRHVDEHVLFESVDRMRQRVEAAVAKTKSARRQMQRIETTKRLAQKQAPHGNQPTSKPEPMPSATPAANDPFAQPIRPFEDLSVKL